MKLRYILALLLLAGIIAVPLSYNIIRHHCNLTNSEYYSFAYNKTSCHPDERSSCISVGEEICNAHTATQPSDCCKHSAKPENDNENFFTSTCCTNQIISLKNSEIFNDYRINLKIDIPELLLPEGFSSHPKNTSVTGTFPEINSSDYLFTPPEPLYILTGHLII